MKASCSLFALLIFLGIIHLSESFVLYGLTSDNKGNNVVGSINITTGNFTFIAVDNAKNEELFYEHISCFDTTHNIFYYATGATLNAVDVIKKIELPVAKFKIQANQVLGLFCDTSRSRVLVAMNYMIDGNPFMLYSYPLTTSKGSGHPTVVADLTADGIFAAVYQTYDPVHNIMYSLFANNFTDKHTMQFHVVNLDTGNVTVKLWGCLHYLAYIVYDETQNNLVGLTARTDENGMNYFYTFTIAIDELGSCKLGMHIPDLEIPSSAVYEPNSATFFISSVSGDSGSLLVVNTNTSQVIELPMEIMDDLQIGYNTTV